MKKLVIIGIAVVILVVVITAILIGTRDTSPAQSPTNNDPFAGITGANATSTASSNISISTREGTSLVIPNVTADRISLDGGDGSEYYDLVHTGPVFGDEGDTFGIQFQKSNSYFLVTLLAEPLGQSRLQAEAFLRERLQLSNSELCTLNVDVFAMYDVNSTYSDRGDLGLSFCPDAVQLPF